MYKNAGNTNRIFYFIAVIVEILVGRSSAEESRSAVEWAKKGVEAYHKGQFKEAVEYYDRAIELDREYSAVYNNRGLARLRLKDYEVAEKDFFKVLELNPNDIEARVNLGNLEIKRDHPRRAISYLSKAIEIKPNTYQAYDNRGLAFMDSGEPGKAVMDFKKALSINPAHASTYNNYALLLASYPKEEYRDGQKALE